MRNRAAVEEIFESGMGLKTGEQAHGHTREAYGAGKKFAGQVLRLIAHPARGAVGDEWIQGVPLRMTAA